MVGAVKIIARALIVGGTRIEVMNSSVFVSKFSAGLVSLGTGCIVLDSINISFLEKHLGHNVPRRGTENHPPYIGHPFNYHWCSTGSFRKKPRQTCIPRKKKSGSRLPQCYTEVSSSFLGSSFHKILLQNSSMT